MSIKKFWVGLMLGTLILLLSFESMAAPIELWCPWQKGQRWQVGGAGNFYGEGYHVGMHHFCVDMNAIDFDDMGQNILAAADGIVAQAFFNDGYGWMVRINHANNCQTLYAHLLEQPRVAVGQRVSHGDIIGRCDNTPGMPFSTGSHLHFCLYQNGFSVAPSPMEGHNLLNGIVITSSNENKPVFACEYYRQDPNGLIEMRLGEQRNFIVAFENTGSLAWFNNADNDNYVELRSVDKDGAPKPSFLCHDSWLGQNCTRVVSQTAARVSSGERAWFRFKGKSKEEVEFDHEYKVYFRVWHNSAGFLDDWAKMHFRVKVTRIIECQLGQVQTRLCDNCGYQEKKCQDDLTWSSWSQCMLLAGLQCDPLQFQIEPCGHCGTMRRECGIDCLWQPWSICQDQRGVCEPGQAQEIDCLFNIGECRMGRQTRFCGPTCLWASLTDCQPIGASPEICDLKDNDCNGIIDNGAHCKQLVYRYYYNNNGDIAHLLKLENDEMQNFRAEGAKFRTYKERVDNRLTPLYKLKKQNPRDFLYTISDAERDGAVANFGYERKGNIGFCAREEIPGSKRLFRLYKGGGATDHFYTISRDERDNAVQNLGYISEGTECWVWEL